LNYHDIVQLRKFQQSPGCILIVGTRPLNRRGRALFFSLMKRTKNQVICDASLRSWPFPCKAGKNLGRGLLPLLPHEPSLQATFPTALQPLLAHIVLPVFARSCTADRGVYLGIVLKLNKNQKCG
jgi:hypothetical protein